MNTKEDLLKTIEKENALYEKTGVAIFGREKWEAVKSKRERNHKLK